MNISKNTRSISIVGCGWYGFEMAENLLALGYMVKGSTTTAAKLLPMAEAGIKPYLLNFEAGTKLVPGDFFDADVLIICIPPKRNEEQLQQYPDKIKKIADLTVAHRLKNVIFISATSVYGDIKKAVTELSPIHPQTLSGKQVLKAEQLLNANPNFNTTILRFSGLVGPGRHPGRFFAGKTNIPNGKAPVNLIHLQDCIDITLLILKLEAFGYTFNASAPDHPQKQVFYTAAAKAINLDEPQFIDELKGWKTISSIQVPKLLNYKYKTDNWMDWLQED
ncbi:NAD-dependent epimerase/dehydratase family protein [Pedobacter immunditicola]|uniref:NAD-dependent epimerase/dehydratase family protein n=1 Tax=Pedobacter immunditicola TaxID=3133440 RepID=UPI00309AC2A6